MALYFYLVIVAAALAGFTIAWHILHHKHHGKKIICPLNSDCEKVVHSRWSRFLGIPLERWGIGYYGLVAFLYLIFILAPQTRHSAMIGLAALASVFAFIFSGYLTYIQAKHLKNWCILCLASALCSSVIFLALLGSWLTVW